MLDQLFGLPGQGSNEVVVEWSLMQEVNRGQVAKMWWQFKSHELGNLQYLVMVQMSPIVKINFDLEIL